MKRTFQATTFFICLLTFGTYCIAGQSIAKPSVNKRLGQLNDQYTQLKDSNDQQAIAALKADSQALSQEIRGYDNSTRAQKLKKNIQTLCDDIATQWPEPKKPGLFSRAGSWLKSAASTAAQKTKNAAGTGLSTLGSGIKATASKAYSGMNYHLFEEGEIIRAQFELEARRKKLANQQNPSNQEIQQLLADVDALQKRADAWYHHVDMPTKELRTRVQSLAIPTSVAPAPLTIIITDEKGNAARYEELKRPATPVHAATPAQAEQPQPQPVPEIISLTQKQAEKIAAQADKHVKADSVSGSPETATSHSQQSAQPARPAQAPKQKQKSESNIDRLNREGLEKRKSQTFTTRLLIDPSEVSEKREAPQAQQVVMPQAQPAQQPQTEQRADSIFGSPATAPATSQQQPAQVAPSERSKALLQHLRALNDVDPLDERKQAHQAMINYLEDRPAELNTLTEFIDTHKELPKEELKTAIKNSMIFTSFDRHCLGNHAENPVLDKLQAEFINAAINSQRSFVARPPLERCDSTAQCDTTAQDKKANWWLTGVGAAAVSYGAYGLYNLYAGTTKTMLGYKQMSLLGGAALPKAWSLAKAAMFKVVLPTVGIAAAGLICYACYRFYLHRKLSNVVAAAKAKCANEERTPEDREQLLKLTRKSLKESNETANTALMVGEQTEKLIGINPVTDYVEAQINKAS